jgi:hypothetical protein
MGDSPVCTRVICFRRRFERSRYPCALDRVKPKTLACVSCILSGADKADSLKAGPGDVHSLLPFVGECGY